MSDTHIIQIEVGTVGGGPTGVDMQTELSSRIRQQMAGLANPERTDPGITGVRSVVVKEVPEGDPEFLDVVDMFDNSKLDHAKLDEWIHDELSNDATAINNGGCEKQMQRLMSRGYPLKEIVNRCAF